MNSLFRTILILLTFYLLPLTSFGQPGFTRTDTIQVIKNSVPLKNPWSGGHNFCQLSDIDLNFDGIKDLVVFDRSGINSPYDKLSTYLNTGTPNQVSYVHAPQYEKKFPFIHDWILLVDYNCDGKEDIFTSQYAGQVSVYLNTSSVNNLQFTLTYSTLNTVYLPNNPAPLFVAPSDIPAVVDIDEDGDVDIVTFESTGSRAEYHENRSMDSLGNCDTLYFIQERDCWGRFTENFSNNTINLMACSFLQDPSGGENRYGYEPYPLHAGSCLTCLDMDADLDKEAVISDISHCNINMVTNGGNPDSAVMTAVDPNFPSNTQSVNQLLFPCPFHLDVNNDGKRDMIFSPNAPNASENQKSMIYYQNTGADNAPVFVFQQNDFLQDGIIDVGEGCYPVLFDYDADGLTDLLIGNGYAKSGPGCTGGTSKFSVTAYKNIGTATVPKFQFVTDNFANLQTVLLPLRHYAPTFGDLDGDGDGDMVVGDEGGNLHRFTNSGGVFTQTGPFNMKDNLNNDIDVGQFATPQLFDLDKDSLIDLIIGERTGELYFYKNTGTSTNPIFTELSDTLGDLDVMSACCTGYSAPFFFLDSGRTEVFIGSEQGYIFHYDNIDNNVVGAYTKQDSMLWRPNEVWEGMRTTVTGKDITGDGLMDLVIGNYRGGVAFYLGDLAAGMSTVSGSPASIDVFPNPSGSTVTVSLSNMNHHGAIVVLYNLLGEEVMSKKLSSINTVVDVSQLTQGVYLCLVRSGNKQAVKKLVVKK